MKETELDVGYSCGDEDGTEQDGESFTVGELQNAIMVQRVLLEDIYCYLRRRNPKTKVSEDLVKRIRRIYPNLRWKRRRRRAVT